MCRLSSFLKFSILKVKKQLFNLYSTTRKLLSLCAHPLQKSLVKSLPSSRPRLVLCLNSSVLLVDLTLSLPLFFVYFILPSSYFSPLLSRHAPVHVMSTFISLHPLHSLCGCLHVCTGTHRVFREHSLLFVSLSLPHVLPFAHTSILASPLKLLLSSAVSFLVYRGSEGLLTLL